MAKFGVKEIYLMLGLGALCLVTPRVANAQVTIASVKVTVSGAAKTAVYCDTSLACGASGGVQVWNLGGGVLVGAGQTLVLTQTGVIPNTIDGNFDTSDRVDARGVTECTSTSPCGVTIEINGAVVYTSTGGDPLDVFNEDIVSNTSLNEAHQWGAPVAIKPNYTLALGYADNEHTATCPAGGCFPSPFFNASIFMGAGNNGPFGVCSSNCYDGGALLITGQQAAPFTGCTVTQGGWGAPPHGQNPGAFLVANFPTATGVTIGLGFPAVNALQPFWAHFDSAKAIQNFLPQGGPPNALSSDATDPAGTTAGVFAGQILTLTLNVQLENFGSLVLSGTGTSLDGSTVTQVLAAADLAISGGPLPAGFSYSSLNDLVDNLNSSFDGCHATGFATGHLH